MSSNSEKSKNLPPALNLMNTNNNPATNTLPNGSKAPPTSPMPNPATPISYKQSFQISMVNSNAFTAKIKEESASDQNLKDGAEKKLLK